MISLSATLAEPQHFSLVEKLLFLLLALASGALFWRRFGPILHKILHSRRDPDFQLSPVARRVWDFFTEVICQVKVIRERPLPGLAHAFVFWGFCVFALITLNHVATPFGARFLRPSGFGGFYYGFAAVWAFAVAVSIAALAIRRFVARPKWLGPVSPESGFIAFLIFALMV